MKPVNLLSRQQREQRRVFQKYLTFILYNKIDFEIEPIMNELSFLCWQFVVDHIYKDFKRRHFFQQERLRKTDIEMNNDIWNDMVRFFLKGNKATLKWIRSRLNEQRSNDTHYDVVLERIFHYINHNEAESDYDFALIMNPNFCDYDEDGWRIHVSLELFLQKLKNDLDLMLTQEHKQNIIDACNSLENQLQYKLIKEIQSVDDDLDILTEEGIQHKYNCIRKLETNQPLIFSFNKVNISSLPFDKPIETGSDEFLLYRLFIEVQCDDALDLFPGKQFAECIDISMSLNGVYSEELWKHSSIDNIQTPIQFLYDDIENQDDQQPEEEVLRYPIVSLQYQLDDAVMIFEEHSPTKLSKRCKRFFDQIRLFCIKESIPKLPDEIVITTNFYNQLLDQDNDCYRLNEVFEISDHPANIDLKVLKPKSQYYNFVLFEQWCSLQTINNVSLRFYSMCSQSKNQLIIDVQDLINRNSMNRTLLRRDLSSNQLDFKVLSSYTKQSLCIYYREACIISELLNDFSNFLKKNDFDLFIQKFSQSHYLSQASSELFSILKDKYHFVDRRNVVTFFKSLKDQHFLIDTFREYIYAHISLFFTYDYQHHITYQHTSLKQYIQKYSNIPSFNYMLDIVDDLVNKSR